METPNHLYVKQLSNGDEKFANYLVEVMRTELTEDVGLYKNAMKRKDYLDAKSHVHRIKHKMGLLGLEKSYEKANNFENGLSELDEELIDKLSIFEEDFLNMYDEINSRNIQYKKIYYDQIHLNKYGHQIYGKIIADKFK